MNPPTARILPFGDDAHDAVQTLLPWHANASLDGDEARWVAAHVAECPRCRADLAIEHRLLEAHAMLDTAGETRRGFEALRLRIRAPGFWQRCKARGLGLLHALNAWSPWARGLVIAQSALLVVMTASLWWLAAPLSQDERFHALGATPSPAAGTSLLVRFAPGASERDMREALVHSGARIVDGPTVTGAYVLVVPPSQAAQALQRLRANAAVELAESLAAGAPR
jgi:hypothetical protein